MITHLVDPIGFTGGLALFWKDSYKVEILSSDNRIIDTKIEYDSFTFFISFVYGDPARHLQQKVWDKLRGICIHWDEAWFLSGDFNELMDNSEKLRGYIRPESSFYLFRTMARNCRLREIPSSGIAFLGQEEEIIIGSNVV